MDNRQKPVKQKLRDSTRITNFKKFKLLLWKNWLFRKRSKLSTIFAITMSIFLSWFMLFVINIDRDGGYSRYHKHFTKYKERQLSLEEYPDDSDDSDDPDDPNDPYDPYDPDESEDSKNTDSEDANTWNVIDSRYSNSWNKTYSKMIIDHYDTIKDIIYYTPDSNISRDLLYSLKNYYTDFVDFRALKDEESLSSLTDDDLTDVLAGITFVDLGNSLPTNLHYRIRISKEQKQLKWNTDILFAPNSVNDPLPDEGYEDTFMMVQHLIAIRFIELSSGINNSLESAQFSTQRFPYPPYYKKAELTIVIRFVLPLFIVVSFAFIFPVLIKNVIHEKETGIKELMKLLGFSTWLQWSAWFVSTLIMAMIIAIIMTILLACNWFDKKPVLPKTAAELFLLILLLYITSSISFSLLLATFFSKPTIAVACAIIILVTTFYLPYTAIQSGNLGLIIKMMILLLPNAALTMILQFIVDFEINDIGLQWDNLYTPAITVNQLTAATILGMFIFDTLVYLILAWYLDLVLPSVHGIRKPWYFLVTKNYWCPRVFSRDNYHEKILQHPEDFEVEPVGLRPLVEIVHLTKRFGWRKAALLAVDNVSFKMYEGQITALLGHNGAGKTTLMSMLTGMLPPTSGTAYINGYNIRSQIDSTRKSLGLCPQHNMLFDKLTCREHLQFFGCLKIDSEEKLNDEVDTLLFKFHLWEKRNTYSGNLSGGMKRKLNLGIALIGRPKIVMLDEPTSGVDPEARREIWDVIQEHREGCCIVLSTHYMAEADALADRIAIMANGQLVCCGSPVFLKTRYGAGYHLHLVKANKTNVNKIAHLIEKHITGSYIANNNNIEVTFVLPADQSKYFANFFRDLELNVKNYGVADFGLSVSTVEDVFLKVGDVSPGDLPLYKGSGAASTPASGRTLLPVELPHKNTGIKLKLKQIIGLLLKRWYYAKRRWTIPIIQILLPVVIVYLGLKFGELPFKPSPIEPPLVMDLAQYGNTVTFLKEDNEFEPWYALSLPQQSMLTIESDPEKYLKRLALYNFQAYVNNVVGGAVITNTNASILKMTAWYNGLYYHTEPLSLNILHNALLKYYTKNKNASLVVENVPFTAISEEHQSSLFHILTIAIYVPLALSILSSSFVLFLIHERASMCKHLQMMTGVGGILFWGVSFMWDFLIHMICSSILSLVIFLFDSVKLLTGDGQIGLVFLILLLYGWSSIAVTYLMSLTTTFPATGFTRLTLINVLLGMVFSMILFTASVADGSNESRTLYYSVLAFRFLPSFTSTFAIMKIGHTGILKSRDCLEENQQNTTYCLELEYLKWDFPGIKGDVYALALTGIFFFVILALYELNVLQKVWYICSIIFKSSVVGPEIDLDENLQPEVTQEKARVYNILREGKANQEVLLVTDLNKNFGDFTAVRGLNFALNDQECFGLIGINGAGKSTTFQMLTGGLIMSNGNAFIYGTSLKNHRSRYLKNIGYCPQINPLIDYLTGREMLIIFSYLRGIRCSMIKETVDSYIEDFDLQDHARKITRVYSGGNKRKLSMALAFIGDPQVVFLDEPTTGVDPIARRKIRNILGGAKRSGKCVVLTSHSMEDCETLCNRVGIMVKGQFRALGGIQYLKNKLSEGYVIFARMKRLDESKEDANKRQINLQKFIELQFPSAKLTDVHQGLIEYQVLDKKITWAYMFETMEKAKFRFNLEDYTVSQTNLDQVFLSLAWE